MSLQPAELFLSSEERASSVKEALSFQVDGALPQISNDDVTNWWIENIFILDKYPALSKISQVCFSCFHGALVESSFNTMGDIIDIRSTNLNIETYSSLQTIRYSLKSKKQSAIQQFKIKAGARPQPSLAKNMATAATEYKKEKSLKKQQKDEKVARFRRYKELIESRAQQIRRNKEAVVVARKAHQKAANKTSKRRLLDAISQEHRYRQSNSAH